MRLGPLFMLLPALALASCIGGSRPAPGSALSRAQADSRPSEAETRQCHADLGRAAVRFTPLPDRAFAGGCSAVGAVQLLDIGVPVSNMTAVRCRLAERFADWVREDARRLAVERLGSELVRIESFGSYACRPVVGTGATNRLSEHALANAIDIAAFVLADGRRVTVRSDWNGPDPVKREFLRGVHRAACGRFSTVLGPDYNAAHHDHFHVDMARGRLCR